MFPSSFVWVDNLANEEGVFCGAVSDQDHERTIELQDRDRVEGHKHYADACSCCGSGSGLIHIQGGLVHNLRYNRSRVR